MSWLDHMMKQIVSFEILLPFIPFLVAFDASGVLPVFVFLTSGWTEPERKKVIRQSDLTAFMVSPGFPGGGALR